MLGRSWPLDGGSLRQPGHAVWTLEAWQPEAPPETSCTLSGCLAAARRQPEAAWAASHFLVQNYYRLDTLLSSTKEESLMERNLLWRGLSWRGESLVERSLSWRGVSRGEESLVERSLSWKGVSRGKESLVERSLSWRGVSHSRGKESLVEKPARKSRKCCQMGMRAQGPHIRTLLCYPTSAKKQNRLPNATPRTAYFAILQQNSVVRRTRSLQPATVSSSTIFGLLHFQAAFENLAGLRKLLLRRTWVGKEHDALPKRLLLFGHLNCQGFLVEHANVVSQVLHRSQVLGRTLVEGEVQRSALVLCPPSRLCTHMGPASDEVAQVTHVHFLHWLWTSGGRSGAVYGQDFKGIQIAIKYYSSIYVCMCVYIYIYVCCRLLEVATTQG